MPRNSFTIKIQKNMKNKHCFTKEVFATAIAFFFSTVVAWAQCVIPITDGQSYIEDFESGQMDCWTVEANGNATWAVMTGTLTNVVAFQNAALGDEARLISPTFDMSGISGATFSFGYAMMGLYESDELVVSYRTSEADSWHELGSYSFSDWSNTYEETFTLQNLSSTYQISFLGRSNGGYYIFIDDIEIASAGGCARPVNLTATEITAFSALIGWSATGNEESWTVEMNGHVTTVDAQPYLIEGLDPQTEYAFRVRAHCGNGLESEWSYPSTFKTHCDAIVVTDDMPYFDDFEASEDFVCWYNDILSGSDGWVIDPGYLILNNTAFFIWLGQEAMLVSAPLDITAVTKPVLTFKHKQRSLGNKVDELSVWYGTSMSDYWHPLETYSYACEDWETVTIALPEASETFYIGFMGKSNDADGVYVDEVWVGNDDGVGVEETKTFVATVTPNPAKEKAVIETNVLSGEVTIFDLYGKEIASALLSEGRVEMDLDGFAKGVYVVRISGDAGMTTIKLVKD